MSEPLRIKIVSKPLNTNKYHLATFNTKISKNCDFPKHIIEETAYVLFKIYVVIVLTLFTLIGRTYRNKWWGCPDSGPVNHEQEAGETQVHIWRGPWWRERTK